MCHSGSGFQDGEFPLSSGKIGTGTYTCMIWLSRTDLQDHTRLTTGRLRHLLLFVTSSHVRGGESRLIRYRWRRLPDIRTLSTSLMFTCGNAREIRQ